MWNDFDGEEARFFGGILLVLFLVVFLCLYGWTRSRGCDADECYPRLDTRPRGRVVLGTSESFHLGRAVKMDGLERLASSPAFRLSGAQGS